MTKERKFAYLMAGLCGVSVASAIGSYIQHKRTASLLKKTVKELAEATPVEIEKEVVDEVIQEALEMKVDSQVDDILEETKKEISSEIHKKVTAVVMAEYSNQAVKDQVVREFQEKVAGMTVGDVRELVVKRSAELVEKKLDGQFDDICKQYNKRLDSIADMYAKVISKAPNLNMAGSVNPGIHLQL